MINFDDFKKIDLRVGKIMDAVRVEGSPKLLKLRVSFGIPPDGLGERQIIAGIGKSYEPASLIARSAVFIVNLEPRLIMGLESQGMILAASGDSGPSFLAPDKDILPGTQIR